MTYTLHVCAQEEKVGSRRASVWRAMSSPSPSWTDLRDDELTTELIQETLACIDNDLWVATACLDRVLDDVELQRELLKLGISRTNQAIQRAKAALEEKDNEIPEDKVKGIQGGKALSSYFANHSEDAQLCSVRFILTERSARLECYSQIADCMEDVEQDDAGSIEENWEDDPWADEFDTGSIRTNKIPSLKDTNAVPLPLSSFLTQHPSLLCLVLVSQMQFDAVRVLVERTPGMFAFRLAILENIPLFADPSSYRALLPAVDSATGNEQERHVATTGDDWCQQPDILAALKNSAPWLREDSGEMESLLSTSFSDHILSGEEISSWYRDRR